MVISGARRAPCTLHLAHRLRAAPGAVGCGTGHVTLGGATTAPPPLHTGLQAPAQVRLVYQRTDQCHGAAPSSGNSRSAARAAGAGSAPGAQARSARGEARHAQRAAGQNWRAAGRAARSRGVRERCPLRGRRRGAIQGGGGHGRDRLQAVLAGWLGAMLLVIQGRSTGASLAPSSCRQGAVPREPARGAPGTRAPPGALTATCRLRAARHLRRRRCCLAAAG